MKQVQIPTHRTNADRPTPNAWPGLMARDGDIELTFTVEALAVFTSVQRLIDAARTWVNSGDWLEENGIEPGSPQAGVMYTRLKGKVAEMERTWHQGVIGLIKLAGGFGELRVMKDGGVLPVLPPASERLLWRPDLPPGDQGREATAVRRLLDPHVARQMIKAVTMPAEPLVC